MQTLFIAYLPDMTEPKVDQPYPSGRNYYTGPTLEIAMGEARGAIPGNLQQKETACAESLRVAKVQFEYQDDKRMVKSIEQDMRWTAAAITVKSPNLKSDEIRLAETVKSKPEGKPRSLSELAELVSPTDTNSTSTTASSADLASLILSTPTPWRVTTRGSLNAGHQPTCSPER